MKKVIGMSLFGIALGCTIFTIVGVFFDITYQGNFSLLNWSYTKMAIGAMLVGVGFTTPAIVYENKKLHYALKVLIHMGIGCTVFLVVAFCVGWIPVAYGWKTCAVAIAGYLLFSFFIWRCFASYSRHEAKIINEKIKINKKTK